MPSKLRTRQNATAEDLEDEEKEQRQKPSMKMTKIINGQERKYYYLKTVKSYEELDKYRFKVNLKKILFSFLNTISLEMLPIQRRPQAALDQFQITYNGMR
jgi:hypothetical protein